MDWLNVKCVEDLKKLGEFKDVCRVLKQDCKGIINIKGRSWNDMYRSIQEFRNLIDEMDIKVEKEKIQNESMYFNSIEAEYIFYLVELDGKERLDMLKATKRCYTNKKFAKTWRDKIAKIISSDKSEHVKAMEALDQLNKLYSEMIGDR